MKYVILFVCCLLLVITTANALSMSIPTHREFTFEPGKEIVVEFAAQNTDGRPQQVQLYSSGDLMQYIRLEPEGPIFLESGDILPFKAILELPDNLEPGTHVPKIGVKGLPPEGQSMIGATTAVQVRLFIRGRYNGSFVKTTLSASAKTAGNPFDISATHNNLGTTNIGEIATRIKVFDQQHSQVGSLVLPMVSLDKDQKRTVAGKVETTGLKKGVYMINATVMVDGKLQQEQPSMFVHLGERDVSVSSHTTRLEVGGLRSFQINLTNEWNERLKFVYARAELDRKKGLGKTDFTSPTVTLGPFQTIPVQGYFDLTNATLGSNIVELKVHYSKDELTKTYQLPLVIVEEGTLEEPVPVRYGIVTFLVGLIILLIVMNFFWFAYIQREIKKK